MMRLRLMIASALLCAGALGTVRADIPPSKYLSYSSEALSAARYKRAAGYSREFLDKYVNTALCTSETLASHLANLRSAYTALGKVGDYEAYCRELFSKIDPSNKGTLVRAFFMIALDCKGDYELQRDRWHSFTLSGESAPGLEFFDANVGLLPADLLASKPLLKAWLPIVRADLLAYGEDYEGAAAEIDKAAAILAASFPEGSAERIIEGLARETLAARRGDWDEAIRLGEANRAAISAHGDNTKELHAQNARLLYYYYKTGRYADAVAAGEKASVRPSAFEAAPVLIDVRSVQGPGLLNSPSSLFADRDYNQVNINLAKALFATGDGQKGAKSADRVLYGLQKDISARYSDFAFNRADGVVKGRVDLLVQSAPALSLLAPSDSLLQGLAYDAALVYKQLSLSAGSLYRDAVARLGNKALADRYRELEQTRMALDLASAEQADSLLERIALLEANLQKNLDSRFKAAPGAMPRWTDVRSALSPGEMAVEFSIAATEGGDRYIASVLKSDSPFPQVHDLCAVADINDMTDHCASTEAYTKLWKPLEGALAGVKTVYFSPAGNLNLLPVEYFPVTDGESFNDRYTTFRLSSTRELALRQPVAKPGEVLLYGGVKYNLDDTEKAATDAAADAAAERFFAEDFEVEEAATPGLRAGIAYLPATLDEIHDIASIFTAAGGAASQVEGAEATETTVKELNGRQVPVLHIATHGFTVPRKSRSRLGRVLAKADDRSTFEEQSLGRSGLMMAGAANTVDSKDKTAAPRFDDGILTGREISRLDLSGVNTVVLSACESGLGEVGSEGVAGLQRGLKRAGVKTLVMSLWKVSDEATAILMADFYRNLLDGKNAAEALRDSQQKLRTMDGGKFADYKFWAPFIILDAI